MRDAEDAKGRRQVIDFDVITMPLPELTGGGTAPPGAGGGGTAVTGSPIVDEEAELTQ